MPNLSQEKQGAINTIEEVGFTVTFIRKVADGSEWSPTFTDVPTDVKVIQSQVRHFDDDGVFRGVMAAQLTMGSDYQPHINDKVLINGVERGVESVLEIAPTNEPILYKVILKE